VSETNGHAPSQEPTAEQLAQAANALKDVDDYVRQVVGTMMRGLLVSCPGIQHHVMLSAIAWQTGNLAADAIVADLKVHFELRKMFKKAFEDGVGNASMRQPPNTQAQPMTAPINLKG
jgi:hypothetical protein